MSNSTGRVTRPASTVSVRAILTHARHPEQHPCAVWAVPVTERGFLWVPAPSPRLRSLRLSLTINSPVSDSAVCSSVCPGAPVSSVSALPAPCTARPARSPASREAAWRQGDTACCRWGCNPWLEVGWLEYRSAVLALQPFTKVGCNLGPFFLPICRFIPGLWDTYDAVRTPWH